MGASTPTLLIAIHPRPMAGAFWLFPVNLNRGFAWIGTDKISV